MTQDDKVTGDRIVAASWWGTAALAATAVPAALAPDAVGPVAQAVAVVLFAAGIVVFLWAYAVAVGRSRAEELSVVGIWFLSGSAPTAVRRHLLGALAVQVAVGVTTASVRPFTSLAFGVLAPLYGLGLAGLWAARHGRFQLRPRSEGRSGPLPRSKGRSGPGQSSRPPRRGAI